MIDILTQYAPRTLAAMEVDFPPQSAQEFGREQIPTLERQLSSLQDETLPLVDRLATALAVLNLVDPLEPIDRYYPSTFYVSPEPQTVGEFADVSIGLMSTPEHHNIALVVGIGHSSEGGTFKVNKETGDVEFSNGNLDAKKAMAVVSAGLSDMVHDRLGLPRPEVAVAEEEPTPAVTETPEEDPFNNGYQAAQYLIGDLLHDTRERFVHGIGAGMLFRRQAVINMEAAGRQYTIDKYTDAQGDYTLGTTYVTMTTETGTVQFQLGPEGVMQIDKGKKWRDRDEGINTIDDVFYTFAKDLVELDALRDDPERYKKL
jgi:hypothetical protein